MKILCQYNYIHNHLSPSTPFPTPPPPRYRMRWWSNEERKKEMHFNFKPKFGPTASSFFLISLLLYHFTQWSTKFSDTESRVWNGWCLKLKLRKGWWGLTNSSVTRRVKVRAWGVIGGGWLTNFELEATKDRAYRNENITKKAIIKQLHIPLTARPPFREGTIPPLLNAFPPPLLVEGVGSSP